MASSEYLKVKILMFWKLCASSLENHCMHIGKASRTVLMKMLPQVTLFNHNVAVCVASYRLYMVDLNFDKAFVTHI